MFEGEGYTPSRRSTGSLRIVLNDQIVTLRTAFESLVSVRGSVGIGSNAILVLHSPRLEPGCNRTRLILMGG